MKEAAHDIFRLYYSVALLHTMECMTRFRQSETLILHTLQHILHAHHMYTNKYAHTLLMT